MRKNAMKAVSVCAAAAVTTIFASQLSALELHWKGGDGAINATNYTSNGTDTLLPTTSDFINIGTGATISSAANYNVPGRARIGHNFTFFGDGVTPSTLFGSATLNHSNGTLSFGGSSGSGFAGPRAGLVVGYNADGTVNVSGGILSVTQNSIIGCDDPDDTITGTGTGTLNVSGGTFRTLNNDMLIGHGLPGVVTLSGVGNINALPTSLTQTADPDLNLGFRTASTFTQTGGILRVANNLNIENGSTLSISAGQAFTKAKTIAAGYSENAPAGNIFVGRDGSNGDTLNISGTAEVNVGNRFLMSSAGAGATNSVVNHSGGTLNVALAFVVSDLGATSTSTYNLSGTGIISTTAELSRVGRRGDGKLFQTGGTATFGAGLAIGDDASTVAGETDNATGLYEISAGTLTTNIAAGDALRIGSAGNGTFRVVGDDGVIDVNGGLLLGKTADGVGNLAYRFETGDLLSVIDVSGIATLASGAGLTLDSSLAAPTQTTYDLLTATDVIDNGVSVSPGWTTQIVAGGNGEILRAVQLTTLYWDTDGATAGSGGETPSGNWDGTAANFTTDAAGASAVTTAATTFADDVVFAAGTDANGGYTVTVGGTQTAHSVQVARGDVTLTGGTLAVGTFDVAAGASGTVASTVSGNALGSVTKTGPGTLTLTAANTYTGGTNVQAGVLEVTRMHENNAVNITGGTLRILESSPGVSSGHPSGNDASVSRPTSISIAAGAQLDITNNDVIIDYSGTSPLATYEALVASGYNLTGDWQGDGIVSSIAANDGNYVVAIADNATLAAPFGTAQGGPLFAGQDVDLDTILIKFTHRADVNLDGVVTPDDSAVFGGNYDEGQPAVWATGDMNYDGIFTPDDAAIFGGAYDESLASLPEPGSLGVLALLSLSLAGRRRRRH